MILLLLKCLSKFFSIHIIKFQLLAFLYWFDDAMGLQCPTMWWYWKTNSLQMICTGLHLDLMSRLQTWMLKLVFHLVLQVSESCLVNFHCRQADGFGEKWTNLRFITWLDRRANPCHGMLHNYSSAAVQRLFSNSSSEQSCMSMMHLSLILQDPLVANLAFPIPCQCPSQICPIPNAIEFWWGGGRHPTQSNKDKNLLILHLYGMNFSFWEAVNKHLYLVITWKEL